ncbi:transcriptional regulator [Ectothiorhodospiraceae bacterium 2226]|nr:transcriptional regulator [Ectothiorhodospiraceae bacterium 2226]
MPQIPTYPTKVVNVIANAERERRLIETAEKYGASGYTVMEVRGGGSTGEQAGVLDSDTSILFMMIVSQEKAENLLASLHRMIGRGHRILVFVTDAEVLRPEKFGGGIFTV